MPGAALVEQDLGEMLSVGAQGSVGSVWENHNSGVISVAGSSQW